MKVKEVMTTQSVISCTTQTTFTEAVKIMKDYNCGALPVVDLENKVVGMITDRDICISLVTPGSTPWEKRTVGDIMTKNVYTVTTDDEISAVFQNMRKNQIGRLPVVDTFGKLNGIVSLHNLIDQTVSTGKQELWDFTSPGENLLKTIYAVTGRYILNPSVSQSSYAAE